MTRELEPGHFGKLATTPGRGSLSSLPVWRSGMDTNSQCRENRRETRIRPSSGAVLAPRKSINAAEMGFAGISLVDCRTSASGTAVTRITVFLKVAIRSHKSCPPLEVVRQTRTGTESSNRVRSAAVLPLPVSPAMSTERPTIGL